MNTKTTLALAGALLLASNVHAGPQDAPKPMDHGKKMDHAAMKMPATPEARAKMANTMFDRIDTDKNGSLSRAEFVEHHRTMSMDDGMGHAGSHAGMKHAGMHHEGIHHEGMKHGAREHAGHAPVAASSAFAALDSNQDGRLSKPEMARHPMAAHFAMMDSDTDGYLSPRELASHGM